jgi:transcriptional regulator with XRE-family HTH domain
MARALSRPTSETFGDRLRRLRSARGLTQGELGRKIGLSQRMVAYYESQGGTPAPPLVAKMAKMLAASGDELLGIKPSAAAAAPDTANELRLWRKLRQIRDLPDQKRRLLLQLIDQFLDDVAKEG